MVVGGSGLAWCVCRVICLEDFQAEGIRVCSKSGMTISSAYRLLNERQVVRTTGYNAAQLGLTVESLPNEDD